jgi:hypothetical protein
MNAHSPIPETDDPAAWAQAMLRRQVERLDTLAELGLDMARAIAAEKPEAAVTAFARVARAVRLTGLLQSRLLKDMDDAFARAQLYAPERESLARIAAIQDDPAHDHKARVERIVERQLKAQKRDQNEVERLMLEACERLDDDDIYRDVQTRPIGELVARICRDLGVEPDWSQLAQEAWAQEEMASASPASPFAMPDRTRPPPLAGEGDHEVVERAFHRTPPDTRCAPPTSP